MTSAGVSLSSTGSPILPISPGNRPFPIKTAVPSSQPRLTHQYSHTIDLSSSDSSLPFPPASPRSDRPPRFPSSTTAPTQPIHAAPPTAYYQHSPAHTHTGTYSQDASPRYVYPPRSYSPDPSPVLFRARPPTHYSAVPYSAAYGPSAYYRPYPPHPSYVASPPLFIPPSQPRQYRRSPAASTGPSTVVSLSLFDDGPVASSTSPHEEQKEPSGDAAAQKESAEAEATALRTACQQYILAVLTKGALPSSSPPWRAHPDQAHPVVSEYESLYVQMVALSPSLSGPSPRASTSRSPSPSVTASAPSTAPSPSPPTAERGRLSVEQRSRPASKDKRGSTLQLISAAVSRLGGRKESVEARESGPPSLVSSPRHSFSMLMPAFSTLRAVTRVMMLARKGKEKRAKGAAHEKAPLEDHKEADEEEDEDDEDADEDDVAQSHPRASSPASSKPSPLPVPTPAVLPVQHPLAPTEVRSARTFPSRYNKRREMKTLEMAEAEALSEAAQATAAAPSTDAAPHAKPSTSASSPPPLHHAASSPATLTAPHHHVRAASTGAAERSPARSIAVPPAKSAGHLRSLSNLPPLPVLPRSTLAPPPLPRAASSPPTRPPPAPSTKLPPPRITHYPFRPPRQPRAPNDPLPRSLYDEKLERTSEQALPTEARERLERRLRWAQRVEGRAVKKWGRRGRPHRTVLHVEDHWLLWNYRRPAADEGEEERRRRREKDGKCVELAKVKGVVPGLDRRARPKVPFTVSVLCFTVLGRDRVLECECATVKERDEWMEGLQDAVADAKTAACAWSGRVLMSIAPDPSVQLTIAPGDESISFI